MFDIVFCLWEAAQRADNLHVADMGSANQNGAAQWIAALQQQQQQQEKTRYG